MKKILLPFILITCLFACKENGENNTATSQEIAQASMTYYGDKITPENAEPISKLQTMMGDKQELNCKLSGSVNAVCKKKGCWMVLKQDSMEMRVTFKDYGFFMPLDCEGKNAIIEGIAKIEVTSIEDLKEYAKDDGQSKEEIDAISEPLKELVFEAKGVILY